jgi:hypothetical protein
MPYGCGNLGTYLPLDCNTDPFFYSKIVAIGIIKVGGTDFGLAASWNYADLPDLLDDVVVLDDVTAEYDGGVPNIIQEAYGAKVEQVAGRKHTVTGKVEYNPKNWALMNSLCKAKNFGVVLITGNFQEMLYSGNRDVTIVPTMPLTQNLEEVRSFSFTMTWSNIDLAKPVSGIAQAQLDLFR